MKANHYLVLAGLAFLLLAWAGFHGIRLGFSTNLDKSNAADWFGAVAAAVASIATVFGTIVALSYVRATAETLSETKKQTASLQMQTRFLTMPRLRFKFTDVEPAGATMAGQVQVKADGDNLEKIVELWQNHLDLVNLSSTAPKPLYLHISNAGASDVCKLSFTLWVSANHQVQKVATYGNPHPGSTFSVVLADQIEFGSEGVYFKLIETGYFPICEVQISEVKFLGHDFDEEIPDHSNSLYKHRVTNPGIAPAAVEQSGEPEHPDPNG
jgi:hypothetical protein